MKTIEIGASHEIDIPTEDSQTAAALGNAGVDVIGTAALVLMVEDVSERTIHGAMDEGEASVGTMVNLRHLAPMPAGGVATARARVVEVTGRRVLFETSVHWGGRLLMEGTHERAVVDLTRFLDKRDGQAASHPDKRTPTDAND
jgi:predicted thioesterase